MRYVYTIAILVLLAMPTTALADDRKELVLRNLDTHLNKVLEKAELAIVAASDYLSHSNGEGHGALVEATLQNYVDLSDGMRAMLVADAKGNLIFDTYNKIASQNGKSPAAINISSRDYFIDARLSRDVEVFRMVRGRTSGIPFVPITKSIYVGGRLKYVVIAIMSPEKLLHPIIMEGEYSGAAIYDEDGNLYVSFPGAAEIPATFFASLNVGQNMARKAVVPFNKNVAETIWSPTNKFGLLVVYSEVKPNS